MKLIEIDDVHFGKANKENCTGRICLDCYQLYDPKSGHNKRKSDTKSRTGQINIEDESGKGLIGEAVRGLEIVVINNNSKWEKFRIEEKFYDIAFCNLISHLKQKRSFGIKDIIDWLDVGVAL